jgi:hypothetical protein
MPPWAIWKVRSDSDWMSMSGVTPGTSLGYAGLHEDRLQPGGLARRSLMMLSSAGVATLGVASVITTLPAKAQTM